MPSLLALPAALFLICCAGPDSAPGIAYDPALDDLDAGLDPSEADDGDAGAQPFDPGILIARRPLDGGKLDGSAFGDDAGGVLGGGGQAGDARAPELGAFAAIERLLAADGKSARVHALDVPSRRYLDSFSLSGPGVIYAGQSGRYGYVLENAQNLVQMINLGLPDPALTNSPTLRAPSLLRSSFAGLSPSAFDSFAQQGAILFAGASELITIDEESLETATPTHTRALGAPGTPVVLVHLADQLLVSERDRASGASSLRLLDTELDPVNGPELSCAEPEGSALAQRTVAVGCADGILLLDTTTNATTTLRYPTRAGGERARKLAASPSESAFLTTLGDQLCVVQTEVRCVDAPAEGVIDFAFDASGKRALVLSFDGTLHFLDGETLAEHDTLALLSALPPSTPKSELPGLAVGRFYSYVSEPSAGRIHIVDSGTAKVVDKVDVPGGFPTQLAVFNYGR